MNTDRTDRVHRAQHDAAGLRVRSLGSGSKGNATLAEAAGEPGSCLLIDCGFSLRQFMQRLQQADLSPEHISGIFVTHEHSDHAGCCIRLAQQLQIPIWMSHGTCHAIGAADMGALLHIATDTVPFQLGALTVTPFTVPHDAREPLQLRCSYGDRHLGILTDLGWGSPHALEQLRECETVVLEYNYDATMLADSPYPAFLKKRISGSLGHLNNQEAQRIARTLHSTGRLRRIIAAHLSEQNNCPTLVNSLLQRDFAPPAAAAVTTATAPQPLEWQLACPRSGTEWISA